MTNTLYATDAARVELTRTGYRGVIRRHGLVVWSCRHLTGHTRAEAEACAHIELESWGYAPDCSTGIVVPEPCGDCGETISGKPYPVGGGGMRRRTLCWECFAAPRWAPTVWRAA